MIRKLAKSKSIEVGQTIYGLDSLGSISEYIVSEVILSGKRKNYKLIRENSSSFCMYEDKDIGRCIFSSYDEAKSFKSKNNMHTI